MHIWTHTHIGTSPILYCLLGLICVTPLESTYTDCLPSLQMDRSGTSITDTDQLEIILLLLLLLLFLRLGFELRAYTLIRSTSPFL
jgi:hypothetical protein